MFHVKHQQIHIKINLGGIEVRKIKKAISIMLLAASLAMTSCAGRTYASHNADAFSRPEDSETVNPVKYEQLSAGELLAELPDVNYGGYRFVIMSTEAGRFASAENHAGIVNPMIEKRNEEIQRKYNVSIVETVASETKMIDKLRASNLAGTQYADLVSLSADTASMLAAEGCLMNLYSVPYFNYNNGYSDPDVTSRSTAKDEMYVLYDPASLYFDGYECALVNLSLLPAGAKQELIDHVNNGTWTWDALLQYAENACTTLEKRSPDYANDIFGYASYENIDVLKQIMFVGGGYSFFGDVCHKNFEYTIDPTVADDVASRIKGYVDSKSHLGFYGKEGSDIFTSGRCAFMIAPLNYLIALNDVNFDWIVLPYPKFNADQEYLTCISKMAYGISVPENQKNSIRTGSILRAIRASSSVGYDNAIFSNYTTFYLRDNESAVMLGKVLQTKPVTDVMLLFCEGNSNFANVSRGTLLEAIDSGKEFEYLFKLNAQSVERLNTNGLK